ncbi:Poly [ADP-ribose] polymerase tankyrase [Gryllus bimaculatus]|nr:Poly [ADP-ribose] polymerase tankyrase [Gryllus bimaculatus]
MRREHPRQCSRMNARMKKDPSRARLGGLEFEFKLAGLVNARLHALQRRQTQLQLRYELATNVQGANPFDDIVLRLRWLDAGQERSINYFVQLKHVEKTRLYLQEHYFVADPTKCRRHNFNLKKYFGFYKALRNIRGMPPNGLNHNTQIIRECAFEEFRFVFYTTMDASALDQLIAEATTDALGGQLPRTEAILSKYLLFLRDWWQSSKGDCLTQSTTELEDIIRDDINDSTCTECLFFQERYCEALANQLQDGDASYIVTPSIPASLRHSKLKLTFGKTLPRTFIIISVTNVEEYPLGALLSVCEKLAEEVVLTLDCVNEQVLHFVGEILARQTCNLRIVSSTWERSVHDVVARRAQRYTTWSEVWALGHMQEIEAQRLLEAHVLFQGHEVALQELDGAWPSMRREVSGATLAALATGDTVAFGAPLPEMEEHYVQRELYHKAELSRDVFQLSSSLEHFFLKGFPESELTWLRSDECPWTESYDVQETPPSSRLQRLQDGGSSAALRPFVQRRSAECGDDSNCAHADCEGLLGWRARELLLVSEPGMGKSTLLARAAHALKRQEPQHWVLLLRLGHGLLDQLPDAPTPDDVVALLAKAAGCQPTDDAKAPWLSAGARFLRESVLRSRRASVLLDGVDEACPAHKAKALAVLRVLREWRVARVWVTARPALQEDLAQALQCAPLGLRPLSEDEQRRYLAQRWGKSSEAQDNVDERVNQFLRSLQNATEHHGYALSGVPLYTRILAEAYKDEPSVSGESPPHDSLSVMNSMTIIRKFVEETEKRYWKKSGIPQSTLINFGLDKQSNFMTVHQICAIFLLFNDENLLGQHYQKINDAVSEIVKNFETENKGIMTNVIDGKPEFMHQTFVEYFAASWLCDHFHEIPKLIYSVYANHWTEVPSFLDAHLSWGLRLHEAALGGSVRGVCEALRAHAPVIAVDRGGRTALHLAAARALPDVVSTLLAAGAPPAARDQLLRWTPLRYLDAAAGRARANAEQLLRAADALLRAGADARDAPRMTRNARHDGSLMSVAMGRNLANVVGAFLARGMMGYLARRAAWNSAAWGSAAVGVGVNEADASGLAPLHHAAMRGHARLAELLLARGADVHALTQARKTPLHLAALGGHSVLCKKLIQAKAKVNACDGRGRRPLHEAARWGHGAVCELLQEAGADVRAADAQGRTALHEAAGASEHGACEVLLGRGADPNARDAHGRTPFHYAANGARQEDPLCCCLETSSGSSDLAEACSAADEESLQWQETLLARQAVCQLLARRAPTLEAQHAVRPHALPEAAARGRRGPACAALAPWRRALRPRRPAPLRAARRRPRARRRPLAARSRAARARGARATPTAAPAALHEPRRRRRRARRRCAPTARG